jgi:hypothetical protein
MGDDNPFTSNNTSGGAGTGTSGSGGDNYEPPVRIGEEADCRCKMICPDCGGCTDATVPEGCEPCSCGIFAEKSEEYDCNDGFVYEQVYPRDLNDNKYDCSEWAYFILAQAKPELAKKICSSQKYANTTKFKDYISANGGFRKDSPKVGDIVMWSGHIEFVTEVSGEKFVMHGFRSAGEKYCPPDHFGKKFFWVYLA